MKTKKISSARLAKMRKVAAARQPGLVVVLEDIHDPHNLGAILRSCDAFGIQDVYVIFEREKRYNPAKVGAVSSATANKWLHFYIYQSTRVCFRDLKKKGFTLIATAIDTAAVDIFSAKFSANKIAVVLGNEHAGLSKTALDLADQKIYIPMAGMVQSLNVSVTAAIMLFAATGQRRKLKKTITPTERNKILRQFLRR